MTGPSTDRRLFAFTTALVVASALIFSATNIATPLVAQAPEAYYVIGQVKKPGKYFWKADVTVAQAIESAGGPLRGTLADVRLTLRRTVNGEVQAIAANADDPVLANDVVQVTLPK